MINCYHMKNSGILKYIIRIALFLLLAGFCLHHAERIFMGKDAEELSPYYYDYPDNTFDVLFLGSSVSKNGVQPVQLWRSNGIASYNLSNGNQSLACSYYLMKDAIRKDHPKLIVLDTTYAEELYELRSEVFLHYLTDQMPITDRYRYEMIQALIPREDRTEFYFPLYSYHSRWKELTASDFENGTYQKDTLGSVMYASTLPLDTPVAARYDVEATLSDPSLEYLQKIMDLCREEDVSLLLMCCPNSYAYGDVSPDVYNARPKIQQQVAELAAANDVPFLNFIEDASPLGLKDIEDFKDGPHLNIFGAEKLTAYLGSYIRDHYDIPDRSSDTAFASKMDRLSIRYEDVKRSQTITTVSRADTALKVLTDYHDDPDLMYVIWGEDFIPSSISPVLANGFQALGLSPDLSTDSYSDYYAVLDAGSLQTEAQSETDWDHPLLYKDSFGSLRLQLTYDSEGQDKMVINGTNCATEQAGLRIAVYNKSTKRLLDCISLSYDGNTVTHLKEAGN